MDNLTEPTLFVYLLQAFTLILYIPFSYIFYRWTRVPQKHDRDQEAMAQLGMKQLTNWEYTKTDDYQLKQYIGPLLLAGALTFTTFSLTHPYIIGSGLKAGVIEEVIDVFGVTDQLPRAIPVARFLFWGFLGAYIYSFFLTFKRFMDYDLTPSVYLFTCNRFLLAFVVCSIVGIGLGTFSTAAGMAFDTNLATVSVVAFFIGFFPEQGINWITIMAKKALGQQGGVTKETSLAEIEGLSVWHQGRLRQESIENVQNLATADVPALVIGTPFTTNQVVDWVDQAILLVYAGEPQFMALENAGVRCATDVILTAATDSGLADLADATGLKPSELRLLAGVLRSAINIKIIAYFRWQSSMDEVTLKRAGELHSLVASHSGV